MLSKYTLKALIFVFYFLSIPTAMSENTTHWQEIAPGIAYTSKSNPAPNTFGMIHFFKINLRKNTLKLALAKDDVLPGETVKWLAEKNHALIAVNGGFFTPLWKPIGLRIQEGKIRSSLQPTSWWHVFYIKNNKPYMISEAEYQRKPVSDITMAVQGGPRLLIDGKITHLKAGFAERTALGITKNGEVIILATEHWPLETADLAKILQKPESEGGFDCVQALNLDGGESTQLYTNIGKIKLDVSSLALITDIVYVIQRRT